MSDEGCCLERACYRTDEGPVVSEDSSVGNLLIGDHREGDLLMAVDARSAL